MRRRKRVKEHRLLIKRIAERMRRSRRHRHRITNPSIDSLSVQTVKAELALEGEEDFVVHLVPVRWRAGGSGRDGERRGADAHVWMGH